MSKATVLEIAGKSVGLLVEDQHGVSFFANMAADAGLEGLSFANLRQLEKAARAIKDSDTSRKRARALRRWRSPQNRPTRPVER